MKKVVAVVGVLLLLAAPSFADLFPDPVELGLLGQILQAMKTVDGWLSDIDNILSVTKQHLNEVWPASSMGKIGYVFNEVRSIRNEINSLACGWNFTLRVQKLWDGLFSGIPFCKPEFNLVYGVPPVYYARDMDEAYDWASTLTIAQVSDWMTASDLDEGDARWLIQEAKKAKDWSDANSPYGPGYSQRLSAVAAARIAKELHEVGNLEAAGLRNTMLRSNDFRLKARKEMDLTLIGYAFLTGQTPFVRGDGGGTALGGLR
jgi:hypothetical protein